MAAIFGHRIKAWRVLLTVLGALLILALVLFPGRRLPLAFTLGTGIGRDGLQARIDDLETRAIHKAAYTHEDREFLADFYRTLATGGKVSLLVRQTGLLMDHYLDASGADYRLDPAIFTQNVKVIAQAAALRKRAASLPCSGASKLTSPTFYMPDRSKIDSVFGLYWGTLSLRRDLTSDGKCVSTFRAEVPWRWPSYDELKRRYGSPHAERFPLPNLGCLVFGTKHALYVGNGLGEYLAQIGLAKPFIAFAEWTE